MKFDVKSVADIQKVADDHNMDLQKMRFFLNENTSEPKAFGIYQQENGDWIVYKNKADGSRTVRYQGPSEEHAAKILFDKLESEIKTRQKDRDWWDHENRLVKDPDYARFYNEEIEHRNQNQDEGSSGSSPDNPKKKRRQTVLFGVTIALISVFFGVLSYSLSRLGRSPWETEPREGYYTRDDSTYYYYDDDWYYWDSYGWVLYYSTLDWEDYDYYTESEYLNGYESSEKATETFADYAQEHFADYSEDNYDSYDWGESDNDYYDSDWSSDWDSDWDSSDDYDYDFSDWDSGDTDWDSDW